MIPKIIHWCWMSGEPLPEKIQMCIDSWKKTMDGWEIVLWNAKNFNVNTTLWTRQAFEAKKYAFVADYIRFYALYHYGGVYLDSDVEVLKSLDDFTDCECFFGYEYSGLPEAAVVGSVPKQKWMEHALHFYERLPFLNADGSFNIIVAPLVFKYAFEKEYGIRLNGNHMGIVHIKNQTVMIMAEEYFSPKDGYTGKIYSTDNTYAIHHFRAAWKKNTLKNKLNKFIHSAFKTIAGERLFYTVMHRVRVKKVTNWLKRTGIEEND